MAPQREWFEKDYYQVLGVPDDGHGQGDQERVPEAVAPVPPRRQRGRRRGRGALQGGLGRLRRGRRRGASARSTTRSAGSGPAAAGFPGGGAARAASASRDAGDLGDLLGGLFGRGGRGGGRARRPRPAPRPGPRGRAPPDLRRRRGRASPPRCTSPATPPCRTCNGSGAAPGTSPQRVRAAAAGQGVRRRQPGPVLVLARRARVCGGRGVIVDDPCPTCRGTGVERRPREVKVRIPAGVDDGQRIRLKGRGGPGRNGGPPGDLYVVVRVAAAPAVRPQGQRPHHHRAGHLPRGRARRRHRRAHARRRRRSRCAIPAGTRSGRTFRVKGKGVATRQGHRRPARHRRGRGARQAVSAPSARRVEALQAASNGASPREHLGV